MATTSGIAISVVAASVLVAGCGATDGAGASGLGASATPTTTNAPKLGPAAPTIANPVNAPQTIRLRSGEATMRIAPGEDVNNYVLWLDAPSPIVFDAASIDVPSVTGLGISGPGSNFGVLVHIEPGCKGKGTMAVRFRDQQGIDTQAIDFAVDCASGKPVITASATNQEVEITPPSR